MLNYQRYKRNPVLHYPEREWPDKQIEKAPIWCSVDLRDGNQALIEPMNVEEKMEMFELLLKLGFKEIEIGFPSASQIEYDFLRKLVEENRIPDDVKVQVLTQCREELIDKTFEAIQGIKKVVMHIYNSTSTLQRDVVFHKSEDEIIDIAVAGTKMVKDRLKDFDGIFSWSTLRRVLPEQRWNLPCASVRQCRKPGITPMTILLSSICRRQWK